MMLYFVRILWFGRLF